MWVSVNYKRREVIADERCQNVMQLYVPTKVWSDETARRRVRRTAGSCSCARGRGIKREGLVDGVERNGEENWNSYRLPADWPPGKTGLCYARVVTLYNLVSYLQQSEGTLSFTL